MKVDRRNYEGLCRMLQRKVESISLHALSEHGYYGLMPLSEADAPDTLKKVTEAHLTRPYGRLFPVYGGHSSTAIYSHQVNLLSRAWHDLVHVELAAPFTLQGETQVYEKQASHVLFNDDDREILYADIIGQTMYYDALGKFPENQKQFVFDFINGRIL